MREDSKVLSQNCTGASVSNRRWMRSYASVGMPQASCASVTLGCTQIGSTITCRGGQTGWTGPDYENVRVRNLGSSHSNL